MNRYYLTALVDFSGEKDYRIDAVSLEKACDILRRRNKGRVVSKIACHRIKPLADKSSTIPSPSAS